MVTPYSASLPSDEDTEANSWLHPAQRRYQATRTQRQTHGYTLLSVVTKRRGHRGKLMVIPCSASLPSDEDTEANSWLHPGQRRYQAMRTQRQTHGYEDTEANSWLHP